MEKNIAWYMFLKAVMIVIRPLFILWKLFFVKNIFPGSHCLKDTKNE